MSQRRAIQASVALVAVVMIAMFVAIVALNANDSPGPAQVAITQPKTSTIAPAIATPAGDDRWMQREQSGEIHTMLQQHQAMMQQMQASASPQMLEIMRKDPMWQMLDSGELIKEMERHQNDITG